MRWFAWQQGSRGLSPATFDERPDSSRRSMCRNVLMPTVTEIPEALRDASLTQISEWAKVAIKLPPGFALQPITTGNSVSPQSAVKRTPEGVYGAAAPATGEPSGDAPLYARPAGQQEQDLRQEVAFWRREAAATPQMQIWQYRTVERAGDPNTEAHLRNRMRSTLAALDGADAKEWHERRELCGQFLKTGEELTFASFDEDSTDTVHARCAGEETGIFIEHDNPDPAIAEARAICAGRDEGGEEAATSEAKPDIHGEPYRDANPSGR